MMPRLLLCVLLAAGGVALAASDMPPAAVANPVAAAPSAAEKLFAAGPALSGTLGELKIQASLRVKEDMREGLEGEYFVFGGSQKILLAGEFERDGAVFLEESENGRNVSGQWDGKLEGDIFSGTWSSFDGSVSKPFVLTVIRPKPAASKKPPTRPAGAAIKP